MIPRIKYFLLTILFITSIGMVMAQTPQWRDMHKVKRKETIYSIARKYEITVEELMAANPEMREEGYTLKKGSYVCIPFPNNSTADNEAVTTPVVEQRQDNDSKPQKTGRKDDVRKREVRVGVMLPLNDKSADGQRMIEYYRGVLMACDSLRMEGISVDVKAWNATSATDISNIISDKTTEELDLIIGPLYADGLNTLVDFVEDHDIKMLIPFSTNAPERGYNEQIYQVYQDDTSFCESVVEKYVNKFDTCHTVIIECNDSTTRKGLFSKMLRQRLDRLAIPYSTTSIHDEGKGFESAFSRSKRNAVILNTGRPQDLNIAFAKLNTLTINNPETAVTLFGHTEWLMYTNQNLTNLFRYDTYVASTFYMNPLSPRTSRINLKYRWNFHDDMQNTLPRLAITGFDQAYFFIKGLKMHGRDFTGAANEVNYLPIQNPLNFKQHGRGGYTNSSLIFIHYTPEYDIETYTY